MKPVMTGAGGDHNKNHSDEYPHNHVPNETVIPFPYAPGFNPNVVSEKIIVSRNLEKSARNCNVTHFRVCRVDKFDANKHWAVVISVQIMYCAVPYILMRSRYIQVNSPISGNSSYVISHRILSER